jgi:photosystem II stability/assembly factor-like uncharacterized protein
MDIYSVNFINDNTGYVLDVSGRVMKTTNTGLNWSLICNLGYDVINIEFTNEQTGFICGDTYCSILKTTNGGYNWQTNALFNGYLNDIEFINSETGYSVGQLGYVLKTTNGGNNWTQLLTQQGETYNSIHCLNDSIIFISGTKILKSSNGGNNWVNITPQYDFYWNLCFVNASTGFTLGSSKIFKTSNSGVSWSVIYNDSIAYYGIYFTDVNTGYLCGSGRILKTINSGLNWQVQFDSSGEYLRDIFFSNNNTGYCVGEMAIIKTTNAGEPIGIQSIRNKIPENFSLYQNYPNPFNPQTKIKFDVPAVGQRLAFDLRLVIYDALGREISTIVNEQMKPGTYEISWDGSNYTSGVYFYKLMAGDYTETRKMILLK